MSEWDVRLPCGCLHVVDTDGAPVRWQVHADRCEHEPTPLTLEMQVDGTVRVWWALVGLPLAALPHEEGRSPDELDALLAAPAPGEFRSWVDRMGNRRQGRVAHVDDADLPPNVARMVLLEVVGGGQATVPVVWLEPPPEPAALARTDDQVADAVRAAADTGVRDAIVRVYDVLREADPEADRTGLQVRASVEVREAARRLADEAARIAAQLKAGEARS